MKTGIGIFRSRFARRLFTVFIVSAILPVLTLASLSFNRVADQLLEQNEQQQRQQVKTIGMAIYERLTLLQTELQMIEAGERQKLSARSDGPKHGTTPG